MSSEPVITITESNDEIDMSEFGDLGKLPVMKITYSVDGKIHRPSQEGPAVYVGMFCSDNLGGNVDRDTTGGIATLSGCKMNLSRIYYYHHGKKHRPSSEGPAEIWYSWGTKIAQEIYYMKGKKHRPSLEGPTEIWYEWDGKISKVLYRKHGKKHRPVNEGPAVTEYCFDPPNTKVVEEYYEHGKRIRTVRYDITQNVIENYSGYSDDEFDDESDETDESDDETDESDED